MRKIVSLMSFLLLIASTASALEFQPVGSRQLGMGGVGVASTMDATAQYWNPAIFGFYGRESKAVFKDKDFGINIGAGAGVQLQNNLAENLDDLAKVDYNLVSQIADPTQTNNLSTAGYNEAMKLLTYLTKIRDQGGALSVKANALLGTRIKRFGVGVYGLGEATGTPVIDTVNVGFGSSTAAVQTEIQTVANSLSSSGAGATYFGSQYASLLTSLQTAIGGTAVQAGALLDEAASTLQANGIAAADATQAVNLLTSTISTTTATTGLDKNTTSVKATGIMLTEVPVTYGHPFGENFAFGVNVKFINGRVYDANVKVLDAADSKNSGDIADDIKDSYKESTAFGLDAGLLWQPSSWFKLGAVGKYLNTPKFDTKTGDQFKIKPQGRAGIALTPFETLTIAADIDLTENETTLPGYKSRNVGAGIEWDVLKFLALRVGAYKNLAESDISTVMTAGVGINLWLLRVDVAAALAMEKSQYDNKSTPEEGRVQVNVSMEF